MVIWFDTFFFNKFDIILKCIVFFSMMAMILCDKFFSCLKYCLNIFHDEINSYFNYNFPMVAIIIMIPFILL